MTTGIIEPTTLRARVEQALAPQPAPTWLVYVPGNGWEEPGTEQQAREVMDSVADELREEAADGWREDAESLIMYRAVQVAAFTLTTTAKPGDGTEDGERCEASGWDFIARGDVVECSQPDLAALVADLWAEVERLTAERDAMAARRVVTVCAEHGDVLSFAWEDDGDLLVTVEPCPLCARDRFDAGRRAAGRNP